MREVFERYIKSVNAADQPDRVEGLGEPRVSTDGSRLEDRALALLGPAASTAGVAVDAVSRHCDTRRKATT